VTAPAADAMHLALVTDRARDYASQAKSPNTLRAYRSDWAHFTNWRDGHGVAPLPVAPESEPCSP
jgi:hypothetical protein